MLVLWSQTYYAKIILDAANQIDKRSVWQMIADKCAVNKRRALVQVEIDHNAYQVRLFSLK